MIHPFLEHDGVLAFAHRGGAEEHPENTMAAFQHAVDLGFKYLETDAHLTRDGKLVAFHDDELGRVTDRSGRIADLTWDEVRRARVQGEPIPRLEALFETWSDVRINIDPKHDAVVEPLAAFVRDHDLLDRVCLTSFSEAHNRRLRTLLGPRLCTGMGQAAAIRLQVASYGLPAGRFAARCAQVPVQSMGLTVVRPAFIAAAHRRGLQVHVWTIDDPDEMERLLDLGVDGLMTDRPSVLKDVLVKRGQWAD